MIVVLVTVPKGEGIKIAKEILERRLAACINIKEVHSMYWEDDGIKEDIEDLLIIKTRKELFTKLSDLIKSIHPYKIPEIVALKVSDVNIEYLQWLEKETSLKKIRKAESSL